MKVSQAKKAEIRRKLVESAIELFVEQGFADASMREISTRAGCSPTTIYNYFSSRDKIFYAFFDIVQDDLASQLAEIPDFAEYTLAEKLQITIESLLDLYRPQRAFVRLAHRALMDSPLRTFSELAPVKAKYLVHVRSAFETAAQRGEIAALRFESILISGYWEYTQLIVHYWLSDRSEGQTQTSQLIDASLDLLLEFHRSGLIGKSADLLAFLVKSHLYGNADKLTRLLALVVQPGSGAEADPSASRSGGQKTP